MTRERKQSIASLRFLESRAKREFLAQEDRHKENKMNDNNNRGVWITLIIIIGLVCLCCILSAAAVFVIKTNGGLPAKTVEEVSPTSTPADATATPTVAPTATPVIANTPVVVPTANLFVFEDAEACPGEKIGCWTSGPVVDEAFSFTCQPGYLCDVHFAQDNRVYIAIGPWTGDVFAWTARPAPIGETAINAACNQAQHLGSVIGSYEVTVFGQVCPNN